MNNLKLNLGQFNECVEYLPSIQKAEYPVDFYVNSSNSKYPKVLFCTHHDGKIISANLSDDTVVIPTFDIGAYANGRISDKKIVREFLCKIELEIFSMIRRIFMENDIEFNIERIVIPILKIEIFDDDKCSGCYGWAEVGIAVFV